MFDHDQAIVEWRRQMVGAGIKTPEVLDELESHLREDAERLIGSGLDAERALQAAARRVGDPGLLKMEFGKVERNTMKRAFIIGAGIVGVLVGMGFVMPAVALYRHEGAIAYSDVALLLLGITMTLGGASVAVSSFRKRKA